MKTYHIFLFIILQSFIHVAISQDIKDGFEISTQKNRILFIDVNRSNFKGYPKDKNGKEMINPSSTFSSKEKLKKIECEVYSAEERNYMLTNYKPSAIGLARASDGKIVSVTFTFNNLSDPLLIDTRKLKKLRERIMDETWLEDLLFNGDKAVSGYIPVSIRFFLTLNPAIPNAVNKRHMSYKKDWTAYTRGSPFLGKCGLFYNLHK